jgi:hypothetical protein
MRKRLARMLSSIVYAGLKGPTDPLYLSNQTVWQKTRWALLAATPVVLVGVVFALSSFNLIRKKTVWQAEPTPAEVASRSLNFKDLKLDAKREVEVLEATLDANEKPPVVRGRIRNLTGRTLDTVDILLDLTDANASQVGAHHVILRDVGPKAVVPFESTVKPLNAAVAVVSGVQTE